MFQEIIELSGKPTPRLIKELFELYCLLNTITTSTKIMEVTAELSHLLTEKQNELDNWNLALDGSSMSNSNRDI